jgi:hypothetical protein
MPIDFSLQELQVAWKRLKLDRRKRVFVQHPYLIGWIESILDDWLGEVRRRLATGYSPHPSLVCNVPKGSGFVRPGTVLHSMDEVVLNAALGRLHKNLWTVLAPSQGTVDIAYQLQDPSSGIPWIKADLTVWKSFRKKSLAELDNGAQYVLITDIAAFYENIDLTRLGSDLNGLGVDSELHRLLMDCLRKWAAPRGRGIPQGYSGSDILAKLYMRNIDAALMQSGYKHLRYVDDIRIFCIRKVEAKKALLLLQELLRDRGLNIQATKTDIYRVDSARRKIDGINPIIENVQAQITEELRHHIDEIGEYAAVGDDVEKIFRDHPDKLNPEILERTFREIFAPNVDFEKTLFHYLIHRLAAIGSQVAVTYCLELLSEHPEETSEVMKYLGSLPLPDSVYDQVVAYMKTSDAIYDYQLYEIVRWFVSRSYYPDELVRLCRVWAFDRNRSRWLRTYCLVVLGEAGNQADLEMIERQYPSATTELERAEIVTALRRVEVTRRNGLYCRIEHDGRLVRAGVVSIRAS